ncbi:MAG TPA: hypothetical protein VFL86_05975 [Burkholderiaceae bacterium]|nr:hypothetical protein [Burkholderiaceae bacterium]
MVTQAPSMEPLSAGISGDLCLRLAQLRVEGATTRCDKLRILLNQLARSPQQEAQLKAGKA